MFTSLVVLATLLSQPAVEDVRARARALLESMCGTRCDVIDVVIETKATPVTGAAPGFDEGESQKVPSAIKLTLLFDANLEVAFRKFAAERTRHRIGEFGLPVLITEQVVPFPSLPIEDAAKIAAPTTPPTAPEPPAAPNVMPAPVAPPTPALSEVLQLKLVESVPLLLLAIILAFVVLRVVGRFEQLASGPWAPEDEPHPQPIRAAPTLLPAPIQQDLAGELRSERASARRVFRSLVLQGEHDTVARAVAILGDFVVRDLAHDPAARPMLPALGTRTAEVLRSPMDEDARDEVLRRIRAELEADRLAHLGDPRAPEVEELLGYSAEAFVSFASKLDERLRAVLLRHAPEHLVAAHLASLPEESRRAALEALFLEPPATPGELIELGRVLREDGAAARVEGDETQRIVQWLDVLPAVEQDAVVQELTSRRPALRAASTTLPLESQLERVPIASIAAAFERVSVGVWVDYLRGAPEKLRGRVLEACPTRLRSTIDEELQLKVHVDPERVSDARRQIVRAVLAGARP